MIHLMLDHLYWLPECIPTDTGESHSISDSNNNNTSDEAWGWCVNIPGAGIH